ncbi:MULTISPECIES: carbohydrate-binding protein [Flavobacterium]|uniref:Carbohydrate-binding protein n=1 Tax=Flavobacterium jumunjinense TaxID=998845 RepID=A0ABV5GQK4_9FLAO|nr:MULTISPECIES: carbohydrate-binding protein [Flavobacterium]
MKTKNQYIIYTLFLLLLMNTVFCQNWQLVWQDEFTNTISSDWVFETGNDGWGNNELQNYRRENATVENGNLVITAKKEAIGGSNYTSARMKTYGKKSWKYGKMEARIAMPSFQGIWPAFWMLGDNIYDPNVGWPKCGEIDIMEHVNAGNQIFGTIHWDHNGYVSYGGNTSINDITAFHTYTVEWDENSIKWFIDGAKFHEVNIANGVNSTNEFHQNYFILLNLAVGGNWPGFTIDNNRFPAKMLVDYVRVYQKTTSQPSVLIQAENYSAMNGIQTEPTTDINGGLNVGYADRGDWMAYNAINFPSSGNYLVEYRVASAVNGAKISSDLNAGTIPLGTVNIPNTGGWQNWQTVSQSVNVNSGTYNFGIFIQNSGVNINWIKITKMNSKTDSTVVNDKIEAPLSVYPNPTDSILFFTKEMSQSKVNVVDMKGQIKEYKVEDNSIDVTDLEKGIYQIAIEENQVKTNIRFIKK